MGVCGDAQKVDQNISNKKEENINNNGMIQNNIEIDEPKNDIPPNKNQSKIKKSIAKSVITPGSYFYPKEENYKKDIELNNKIIEEKDENDDEKKYSNADDKKNTNIGQISIIDFPEPDTKVDVEKMRRENRENINVI